MRVVEQLDSPERDARPAGRYLEDHANDDTVKRFAALLRSHSSKLGLRALRFLDRIGARAHWPTQVEDLKASVQRWSAAADLLAALDSDATFDALMELARDPNVDAASIGSALRSFDDGKRAIALGFRIIDCDASCAYPKRDELIAGLFDEVHDGATRSRLLAILLDPLASMEKRRLAFAAYQATQVSNRDPDIQLLENAFSTSSGELRAAMVGAYPDLFPDAEQLRRAVARNPEEGLRLIERGGRAALALVPTVEPFLHGDDVNLRFIASEVMHAIARDEWRARVENWLATPVP